MRKLSSLCDVVGSGTVIIIGPNSSGKTTIIRDILSTICEETRATKTFVYEYEKCEDYRDLVNAEHYFSLESHHHLLWWIFERVYFKPGAIVVFDDCAYSLMFMHPMIMKSIGERAQCIVSLCYPFGALSEIVDIGWVVVLPCDLKAYCDQLFAQYIENVMSRDVFCEIMEFLLLHGLALVVNKKTKEYFFYDSCGYRRLIKKRLRSALYDKPV